MRKQTYQHRSRATPPVASDLVSLRGTKILHELVTKRPHAISEVKLSAKSAEEVKGHLAELLSDLRKLDVIISYGANSGEDRGGVTAYVKPATSVELDAIIESESAYPIIIGLDGVTDPQNLGAIFRLADAVGAKGIFTSKDRSCPLTGVVRKVSSGATEFINISYVNNFASAIRELKEKGYWIVGSALNERAVDLYETSIPSPVCLLLGSEGEGLRRLSLDLCDIVVKIPMSGVVGSLNVSQAGSVLAFEVMRKIRADRK